MKRSLKDFLLTLVISIVIFAVVAFFLIRAAEGLMGDVVGSVRAPGEGGKGAANGEVSAEDPTRTDEVIAESRAVSMLFVVTDEKDRADAIFLLGVEPDKKSSTMVLIPKNTGVTEAGVTYRLGDLNAQRQSGSLTRFIQEQTGIQPTYYLAVTRDGFSNWIDFLGGVHFNVPRDMEGFDTEGNRKISLRAGAQVLTGDQVAQFLAFDDYGTPAGRDDALLNFSRSFVESFLVTSNLKTAHTIYYNVARHMTTDFEEKDLTVAGPVLFRFNEFSPNIVRIPGSTDANGYYSISTGRVTPMFEIYR